MKDTFAPSSSRSAAPGHQVNNENDDRHYQQQVDQASSYVQAKTQQPQDQENRNYCPKHCLPFE
jgi:hypothetical protein